MLNEFKYFQKKNVFIQSSLKIHNCPVFDNEGLPCFQSVQYYSVVLNIHLFSMQTHSGVHEVCI